MADTGHITPPIKPPNQGGGGRGALVVQIIKVPTSLENNARAIRLEGQIVQTNTNNGTARIQTESGSIDVKIRGNQAPVEGQRIIIDVPAGRPPRQASIQQNQNNPPTRSPSPNNNVTSQPAPTPQPQVPQARIAQGTAQPPQTPAPNQTQSAPTTNYHPTATAEQQTPNTLQRPAPPPPLPPEIQAALTRKSEATNIQAAQRTQTPLAPENVVRLTPVQPAQAQAIAFDFNQTLIAQPTTVNRVAFTANLVAQDALQNLPQNLLQTAKPTQLAPPTTPISLQANTPLIKQAPFAQIIPQNQTIPLQTAEVFLNQPAQTQTSQPTLTPSQTTQITQTIPPTTNQAVQTTPAIPTQPMQANTPLIAAPISFDPTNTASFISPRTTPIDIQIIQITSPTAVLTHPKNTIQPLPAATVFTPPIISSNPATAITAQVTGFTPQGLPLVTTQWPGSSLPQSFILQHNSNNLSLGAQLLASVKAPVAPLAPMQTQALSNPLLQGFQWPALDDLYNALMQLSPQAAASLGKSLPSPSSALQIAPAAMMFIAAVKSGDVDQWLGQNKLDVLQRSGRENILSRLTQGDATARAPTAELASTSDWRAVPLPMFWEGEIHKITLYTRNENQNQQQQDNQNGQTRFIFDLSLSRMGDVQLDGLLRDQRLDLVIRTQHGFSESMQQTMRQAYTTALDHTELRGDLNFQGSTKNWVHVLEKNEQLGVDV